jgi:hypothetical protein
MGLKGKTVNIFCVVFGSEDWIFENKNFRENLINI